MSDQNGVIIGYVVNVTVIATGEMFQLTTTSTNLALDSLQPFTTYMCRIAVRTAVGIGPYSIAVVATTEQAGILLPQNINSYPYCSVVLQMTQLKKSYRNPLCPRSGE